ncbi:MAG: protein TolQ [Gammaproteobacteria bacterium]|nr:protein TolQ [Gammaproteobacteria bacterium]
MGDLSIIALILGASIPVQLVMLLLLIASVVSWALIFSKWRIVNEARDSAEVFEGRFWSGINLSDLFSQLTSHKEKRQGLEQIFESGFREFARARKAGIDAETIVDSSHRAMRVAMSREVDHLESNLSFLATVGSTSPYVGLFGTVWGIMNSFHSISGMQQVTLAQVAPGIAEALIATAMGLLAAIPAVIAYNRFASEVDRVINRYQNFMDEFSGVLQRQAHAGHEE